MKSTAPFTNFFNKILSSKEIKPSIKKGIPPNIKDNVTTAEKAVSCVKSGDKVFVGTACATPQILTSALEGSDKSLDDVKLYHYMMNGAIPFKNGVPQTRFYHISFFIDNDMKEVIKQGKGDYVPISIAQVVKLLDNGGLHIDVALVQVSMPDQNGYVSLGVSSDITHTVIQQADIVIAELNPNMPKTFGDNFISIDQIDWAVIVDQPILEYTYPSVDEIIAKQIGHNVARIIDDGSTIQIGFGELPNEILKYLADCNDLGIHSDLITDAIVDLIEKGVINGKAKTNYTGKIVASYCLGTKKLFDLINGNPMFSFHPIEYVCDSSVLSKNYRLVSITQALSVDLMGQVCSDQYAGEFHRGISTQPDFMRGAANSPDGRPIICLTSTTEDGKESRIRPILNNGEAVSIPRSDVHYVVTEYGTAYLFGKSVQEKALALIEVAHPSFRSWLLEQAKKLNYLRIDQDLKCMTDGSQECVYPQEEDRQVVLKNKATIGVRPAKASDVKGLQDLFYKLPPSDVYTRFFSNLTCLSISKAAYFCNVDYEKEMAFVATNGDREQETIVGSSFYVVDPSTGMAEVAYMILHEWHGIGLGSTLQQCMFEYAKSKGVKGFTADILIENTAMLKLAQKCCSTVTTKLDKSQYEVKMLF